MGDGLGWAFDPIGQAFAGGPFWSSNNSMMGGKGGGAPGRPLTPQEQQLIQAQTNAFNQQQAQSGQTYALAQGAFRDVQSRIPGLQTNAYRAAGGTRNLADRADYEGRNRRSQLESILAAQPGDINALRGSLLRPDIGMAQNQATEMAMRQAYASPWNPSINNQLLQLGQGVGAPGQQAQAANLLLQAGQGQGGGPGADIFRMINARAQGAAGSNPLAAYAGRLQGLSGQSPAAQSIAQLQNLGSQSPAAQSIAQLLGLSGDSPAAQSIAQLQNLGSQSPAAQSISQLQALSQGNHIPGLEDLRSLAGRAGQIGAQPGAAEAVLTPGAVELLGAAQRGETPEAIARIFQSDNTAERRTLENQFDAARQRLVDRGIRGGALERSLAGLEGQRALGISSQEARLENQARDATLGLLGQGTTFGLNQPFQREQLALQGIRASGELEGLAGNLGLSQAQLQGALAGQAGQLGLSQQGLRADIANQMGQLGLAQRGQTADIANSAGVLGLSQQGLSADIANQMGQLGLAQQGLQGNLANMAGNMRAQNEQLRQGFLGLGLNAGQALSGEGLQLQQLRNQALMAGGGLAGDAYQNQLAGLGLQGQFLNDNIRNTLAANQAQTANIGLAGQMSAQQIASQLGISQQNASILSEIMNQRSGLAGQLGAGADALRFSTAPSLLTQGTQLDMLAATAPGLALDLLTGGRMAGSGSVDLSGALAAINAAQNYQQGPSPTAAGISGGLGGAMAGAQVGSMIMPGYGTAIGAFGGGLLGLFGGMS